MMGTRKKEKDKMTITEYNLDQDTMCSLIDQMHKHGHLKKVMNKLGISIEEPKADSDESAQPCGYCSVSVTDEGVICDICSKWYHYEKECSGIDRKFKDLINSPNIIYLCNNCKEIDLGVRGKGVNTKVIENKLEEIKSNSDQLKLMMQDNAMSTREVADNINTIQGKIDDVDKDVKSVTGNKTKTYAESVKTKKALVIKSTRDDVKLSDKKKAIMSKITSPVEEVKEINGGGLLLGFEKQNDLEQAKTEFEKDKSLVVHEKGKLRPKIKIVNVPNDEEDILSNIKMKNPWITNLIENEDEDLKLIKEIKAKDSRYKHYVLKCTPQIRKVIDRNDDKVFTLYKHCRIYDHYMPYQCFKCQEFGHTATNCRNNQVCPRCSEAHTARECRSTAVKCNNCTRKGYAENNHKTFDSNKCTVYKEEISKVRNNTDHGFD